MIEYRDGELPLPFDSLKMLETVVSVHGEQVLARTGWGFSEKLHTSV